MNLLRFFDYEIEEQSDYDAQALAVVFFQAALIISAMSDSKCSRVKYIHAPKEKGGYMYALAGRRDVTEKQLKAIGKEFKIPKISWLVACEEVHGFQSENDLEYNVLRALHKVSKKNIPRQEVAFSALDFLFKEFEKSIFDDLDEYINDDPSMKAFIGYINKYYKGFIPLLMFKFMLIVADGVDPVPNRVQQQMLAYWFGLFNVSKSAVEKALYLSANFTESYQQLIADKKTLKVGW